MKKKSIDINKGILMIVLLFMTFIVVACAGSSNSNSGTNNLNTQPSNTNSVQTTPTNATVSESGKIKLADSQYANYAYLISGDTLDTAAQTATSGFTIHKTINQDNTVTISLTSVNPEYKDQTYTLQSGQQLYFIERNLGDDAGGENALGDDSAIVVDSQGYIVQ